MFSHLKFDVEIEGKISNKGLSWPEPGEAKGESCLGCNRSYLDLRRLPWSEARRVFSLESELVQRIESAADFAHEYDLIEDELYEDPEGIYGLDIGVASTVVALSAARCVPFSSCNAGAFGGHHHERYPLVAFYVRAEMVELLLECASSAGIGLTSDDQYGYVVAYANDIRGMLLFASTMISTRSSFNGIVRKRNGEEKERE